jgi:crossover junction endonuclease MUS81
MITIDSRETSLIQECTTKGVEFNKVFLNLGDIIVNDYLIERKTRADLSASIKDGRFREQKERLSSQTQYKVIFLIENSNGKPSLPEKTLMSAIMNLTLNHNFQVLWSSSIQETCDIIQLLQKKVTGTTEITGTIGTTEITGMTGTIGTTEMTETTGTVLNTPPTIKKCDKLLEFALASQLNTIPGVSWKTALKIQEEHKTMSNLVEMFKTNDKLLVKYGKMLNTKIFKSIFGNELKPECAIDTR